MDAVSLYDAKANLSKLVSNAQRGKSTVITKHGHPAAFLTPVESQPKISAQRTGFLKGRYTIPADFDTAGQAEILSLFEGEVS